MMGVGAILRRGGADRKRPRGQSERLARARRVDRVVSSQRLVCGGDRCGRTWRGRGGSWTGWIDAGAQARNGIFSSGRFTLARVLQPGAARRREPARAAGILGEGLAGQASGLVLFSWLPAETGRQGGVGGGERVKAKLVAEASEWAGVWQRCRNNRRGQPIATRSGARLKPPNQTPPPTSVPMWPAGACDDPRPASLFQKTHGVSSAVSARSGDGGTTRGVHETRALLLWRGGSAMHQGARSCPLDWLPMHRPEPAPINTLPRPPFSPSVRLFSSPGASFFFVSETSRSFPPSLLPRPPLPRTTTRRPLVTLSHCSLASHREGPTPGVDIT